MTSNGNHAKTNDVDTKSPGWTIFFGILLLAVGIPYGAEQHWGLAGLSIPLIGGVCFILTGVVKLARTRGTHH